MKKIYTTTLILLTAITAYSQVYYVAPGGTAALSTNINAPGSLTFAVANAVAGNTVWVKAGNYGALNLVFQNSGTAQNPIQFIGYRNNIGDIDSTQIPTTIPAYLTGSYSGNNAVFPTLDGINRATAGLAMQLYGVNYVTIRNFHITRYNFGLGTWNSGYLNFENIICAYIGNPNNSYNGVAISISNTSYSSARHCFVYNAAAAGISVVSSSAAPTNYNVINRCRVICDDTVGVAYGPATDYYFVLGSTGKFDAEYNEISDCYAERVGNLDHGGHGFAVVNYDYDSLNDAGKTRYNTIKNCTSVAIRSLLHLRGKETEYNTFSSCTSYAGGEEPGGIAITDSRYNTFDKIETNIYKNSVSNYYFYYPVVFYKYPTYSPGYPLSAVGNVFTNCLFKALGGVGFGYYENGTFAASADSNRFVNCTFVNTDTAVASGFILAQRLNNGNSFENCIISGYQNYMAWQSSQSSSLTYENCAFYNNGFTQVGMTNATLSNCIFQDPQFVNPIAGDFHLQSTSPCIDAGKNVTLIDDFDGNERPCNDLYDIGAYEFQNCTTTGISSVENNQGFKLYPNPANYTLNISGNELPKDFEIAIYGIHGTEISRHQNQKSIDISGLASGVYFVTLTTNKGKYTQKLIKN